MWINSREYQDRNRIGKDKEIQKTLQETSWVEPLIHEENYLFIKIGTIDFFSALGKPIR